MALSELFEQIKTQENINIPEGWLQGRTLYGGLAVGILMQKALLTINDPSKQLLNCNVTFVGPVVVGEAKVTAEILRQGKSVTSIEVRLWQNEAVQTILLASFGSMRESVIHVDKLPSAPAYPDANTLYEVRTNPMMPQFMQHLDLRWAEGGYPFMGADQPDFGGWMRFHPEKHPSRSMQLQDFITLLDAWPPAVLPLCKGPVNASSLSWQVTMVNSIEANLTDWFKYKVTTDHAQHGYAMEYAYVWDQQDRLIAIYRQTVTVFA